MRPITIFVPGGRRRPMVNSGKDVVNIAKNILTTSIPGVRGLFEGEFQDGGISVDRS